MHSLKKQKDFQNVYQNGSVFGNRQLVMIYKKNNLEMNRIAVVASKKVSNRAVDRNRLRRQIKEAYRHLEAQIKPGYDIIFVVKKYCLNQPYVVLEKALNHLMYKKDLFR